MRNAISKTLHSISRLLARIKKQPLSAQQTEREYAVIKRKLELRSQ